MSNPEVFRPRSNVVYGLTLFVLCVGLTGASIVDGNFHNVLTAIVWSSLVCATAFTLFIRPKIIFYDEGIVVINPFHRFTIGWGAVESIEARYTMYLLVKDRDGSFRKIHAWAAPAPGRYHARTIHPSEIKGMRIANPENMRPGESPRTHSGVAAHLARLRFDAFRSGDFASARYEESFDRTTVLIIVGIAISGIALWLS